MSQDFETNIFETVTHFVPDALYAEVNDGPTPSLNFDADERFHGLVISSRIHCVNTYHPAGPVGV